MSLATRCPHCNTIFKVVQDQLKVSEGWVRCGRCTEVFNALEGLFDMEREAPPQRVVPSMPPAGTSGPVAGDPLRHPAAQAAEPSAILPASGASAANAGRAGSHDAFAATEPAAFTPEPDTPARTGQAPPAPPPATLPQASTASTPPAPDDDALVTDDLPPPDSRPTRAVTHFELDLPPSDEAVAAAMHALTQPAIQTSQDDGAQDYPITDEADALDSRYLLPSDERRAGTRRRARRGGPEFADAEFPSDLMSSLDEDWAAGWSQPGDDTLALPDSSLAADALLEEPAIVAMPEPAQPPALSEAEPPAALLRTESPASKPPAEPDAGPSTIPSRLPGDGDYQPEQSLPPPSKRKGRPGTRGRGPQTEAPAFIKQAERQAIWRHPGVRALLSFIALGLLLLLGAQVAQQEHDRLASRYPALTPYLAQWCHLTGCRLDPPLQIEDLQVDNITLVKTSSLGEDTYRLTAIIHNRAEAVLAWPHLDLSLTDANGAVVVRRVFDVSTASRVATDAGEAGAGTDVPAAVPASSSTTLQWRLRAPDLALAGYTVELFYP